MNEKQTPGPWFAPSAGVHAKAGGMVASCGNTRIVEELRKQGLDPAQRGQRIKANARLIASAPDLLAACKEAASLYDHMALGTLEAAVKYGPDYEPPTDEDCLATRGQLEAAIAKAEANQ